MLAHVSTPSALVRIVNMASERRIDQMFLRLAWCVAANGRAFIGHRLTSWGTTGLCGVGVVFYDSNNEGYR